MPFPSRPSWFGEEYSYVALDYMAFPITVLLPHLKLLYYTPLPTFFSAFKVRDQASHPNIATAKIIILYILDLILICF